MHCAAMCPRRLGQARVADRAQLRRERRRRLEQRAVHPPVQLLVLRRAASVWLKHACVLPRSDARDRREVVQHAGASGREQRRAERHRLPARFRRRLHRPVERVCQDAQQQIGLRTATTDIHRLVAVRTDRHGVGGASELEAEALEHGAIEVCLAVQMRPAEGRAAERRAIVGEAAAPASRNTAGSVPETSEARARRRRCVFFSHQK